MMLFGSCVNVCLHIHHLRGRVISLRLIKLRLSRMQQMYVRHSIRICSEAYTRVRTYMHGSFEMELTVGARVRAHEKLAEKINTHPLAVIVVNNLNSYYYRHALISVYDINTLTYTIVRFKDARTCTCRKRSSCLYIAFICTLYMH